MAVLNGTKLGDFIIGTADSDPISGLDGNDTVITLDRNDCLVPQNTQVGALTDGDFAFV